MYMGSVFGLMIRIRGTQKCQIRIRNTNLNQCCGSGSGSGLFGHPDPDPDPGKYRIRILYPQKDPMLFKFSRYKIV